MKVWKLEVMVLDHNYGMDESEIVATMENVKYVNSRVMKVESVEIGEWSDDHPLNHSGMLEEYRRLFP